MLILKADSTFLPLFCSGSITELFCELEAYLPMNPGQAGSGYNRSDAWDYLNINSVDKDDNGSYLISARDANTIYKINGRNGSIIWRLGSKHSNFTLGPDVPFSFQRHARYLSGSPSGSKRLTLTN
jgi:Arylsulfotransferase (ASST)